MRISEAMTSSVKMVDPENSIMEAARLMAERGIGVLPVAEGDRLVGMISDRDIAVRAVASGFGAETKVRDVMTSGVKYCFVDQPIDQVSENMGDIQLRRLPVLDRNKRLVGIVALADIANCAPDRDDPAVALCGISRPGMEASRAPI